VSRPLQVKQDLTTRREMNLNEIQELYQAIQDNNLSKFGIIKLGSLVLEKTFVVMNDALVGDEDGETSSLMKCAVSKGRDKIIAALIRGGYDPSVHPAVLNSKKSLSFFSSLCSFPPGYSVWLVKFVYQMIDNAISHQPQTMICGLCARNVSQNTLAEESGILLKWKLCGHETCCHCTWETVCKPLQDCGYSLRCPICKFRCDGGSDTVYLDDSSSSVETNGQLILIRDLTSLERCHFSNQLWTQLPSELPCDSSEEESSNSLLVNKRPPFLVGPLFEVSRYLIGTTQEQRLVEFHRSIVDNNISRMYWIFLAGINVNGQNQYGQTGLMIAATLGHLDSVKFLIWCGADPTIPDHILSHPSQAAVHHNHYHINDLLNEAFGDLVQNLTGRGLPPVGTIELSHSSTAPLITTLIPCSSPLSDGIGSCYIDNFFSDSFLEYLDTCFNHCHTAFLSKPVPLCCCPQRYHLYDSDSIIRREISSALAYLERYSEVQVSHCHAILPMMKYLHYTSLEAKLEPHLDLSKYDPISRISSTHTLILYLTTCEEGGETILMDSVINPTIRLPVKPKRGRMLLFPHHCPHEGGIIRQVPKILLRCEAY
jgi:ankyrin repeat protein